MRVAVCLSGHVRTYEQAWASLFENLVHSNRHHHFDFFLSTWQNADTFTSHQKDRLTVWGHNPQQHIHVRPTNVDDLRAKFNPVAVNVEEERSWDGSRFHAYKDQIANPEAWLSMTYKIKDADRLRQSHQHQCGFTYDAVIRSRFDLRFPGPLLLDLLDLSKLYVTPMWAEQHHNRNWTNDLFAVANDANMRVYARFHDCADGLCLKQGIIFQPEILLYEHLTQNGVKPVVLDYRPEIVR